MLLVTCVTDLRRNSFFKEKSSQPKDFDFFGNLIKSQKNE
jgi:hypothetical protein